MQLPMTATLGSPRYQFLDFTRGIAIGLMFIFHFCFGLSQLGYLNVEFSSNLFWVLFRFVIVFMFLSLVGIGLFLATRNKLNLKAYFKRLALLLVYLSLITLLSKFVRPNYYVYFGILHLIFVSSLLGLLFVKLQWMNLVLGVGLLIVGYRVQSDIFDHPLLQWIGMTSIQFSADDYAPLLPWFGLVLIGIFLGQILFNEQKQLVYLYQWKAQHWFSKLLSWAGRYSIHLYFFHFQFFYIVVYFSNF